MIYSREILKLYLPEGGVNHQGFGFTEPKLNVHTLFKMKYPPFTIYSSFVCCLTIAFIYVVNTGTLGTRMFQTTEETAKTRK